MVGRLFRFGLSPLAVCAALWLAPRAAAACDNGVIECGGVCCPQGVAACFNNTCDTATGCSNVVCGGVCCPDGVTTCFNGECDTAGTSNECTACGSGCCNSDKPVCCGDNSCAASESECGGSGCAIMSVDVATGQSSSWFAIPSGLLAIAAVGAVRRHRGSKAKSTAKRG